MQRKLSFFFTGGFLFTCIAGTLSHFIYEWSGYSAAVAPFVPVNESTWEHLKLLYFPALLWMLPGCLLLRNVSQHLLSAYAVGLFAGLATIPTAFYTYSGILGFHLSPVDIAIFYLSTGLTFCCARRSFRRRAERSPSKAGWAVSLSLLLLALLTLCFFAFTYSPPALGIFADPTTR